MTKTIFRTQAATLFALLLVCSLPLSKIACAQSSQQLYAGFSYVRTDDHPNVNALGWEAMYSQYPYISWRWIGATLEAGGVYATPELKVDGHGVYDLLQNEIYTYMGGPSIRGPHFRKLQPMAHVLLGAVITDVDSTGKGTVYFGNAISESRTAFGLAIGGGLDYHLNHSFAVRGNVDWLRSTFQDQNIDRQNNLKGSVGIVVKF